MRWDTIRTKRVLLLAMAILAAAACNSRGKIIYVDDNARGLGDGSSWVNAFDHLQDALALARTVQKPVEIRVGQGIYRPDRTVERVGEKHGTYVFTFELVEGAVLRGGYAGVLAPDPNVRDVHKYRSTLSGDLGGDDVPTGFPRDLLDVLTPTGNVSHVVTGEELTAATVLDGFAITGGRDTAIPRRPAGQGGPGLRLTHANAVITNCWFHGNAIMAGEGGGILSYGGNPTITNCLFTDNHAGWGGGALATYGGDAQVINCTFYNNSGGYAGAISNRCTVSNCILWGNHPNEAGGYPVRPDIAYSNIAGGWQGEGNVDVDPCFAKVGYWADPNSVNVPVDPNSPNAIWIDGDYHLKSQAGRWDPNSQSWVVDDATSPCIDGGDPNSPVGDEPQPNGGRINMGAYGGTIEASLSATPQELVMPRVVYVFSNNSEAAEGFVSLLEGHGCSVSVVALKDVTTSTLADCDVVIVGNDTGYLSGWGNDQSVTTVKESGKPVIGLGEGGYALFGKLRLAIGHPNGGHASNKSIYVVDPNASLFARPNPIAIGPDRILSLYSETADVNIYLRPVPETVIPLGRSATGSHDNYPLVLEAGRFLLWGFVEPPAKMTQAGKDLFLNAVVLLAGM
ncbi:MAG: right-handed parallel beta-helix repeat-containing protein [Sedimentisphaerales bacterium]|nr:right-handed parallel beta-helix repeat-containing protein [Sedimentisphaerales bacterium]